MKDYYNYSLVNFLLDDSFVDWVKQNCPEDNVWAAWVKQHPDKEDDVSLAKKMIISLKVRSVRELSASEIHGIADAVNERLTNNEHLPVITTRKKVLLYGRWFKAAAAILLITTLGLLVRDYRPGTEQILPGTIQKLRKIEGNKQVTSHAGLIKLPDGTSVILKKGSVLRYPAKFNGNAREVHLNGEAYFEVKKNASHPFLVYSNELVTKVLGTSFFVKAWKGDKAFKVTVTSGKVSVFKKSEADASTVQSPSWTTKNKGVLVMSNQEVTFYREQAKLIKLELSKHSVLSEEIAKTEFNFIEAPFSEVVTTLSNAYNVPINYDETTMAGCPLTASLTDQSFYEKLVLICKAVEATFEMQEGTVVIRGKGCDQYKPTNY